MKKAYVTTVLLALLVFRLNAAEQDVFQPTGATKGLDAVRLRSPQETFETLNAAWQKKDYRVAMSCLTPAAQDKLASELVTIGQPLACITETSPRSLSAPLARLKELWHKHGLDVKGLPDQPWLVKPVDSRLFVEDFLVMWEDREFRELRKNFESGETFELTEKDAILRDMEIKDDVATATLEQKKPLLANFKRIDGKWKIDALAQVTLATAERPENDAPKKRATLTRVTGRVVSTGYAKKNGRIERAIVDVSKASIQDRVQLAHGTNDHFDLSLAPGKYRLQFTANGSRGAVFTPKSQEIVVEEDKALDLGDIDLAPSKTTQLYGEMAPALSGAKDWRNTRPLKIEDLRGKVVLLDFWNYGCTICHQHLPELERIAKKYAAKGLVVLTVHDDSLESFAELDVEMKPRIERMLKGKPLTLPIILDDAGAESVFRNYGIGAVPAMILIDQQGRVVRRFHHAGGADVIPEIEQLLLPKN